MTKVISFANQKGGVGKTTLCLQTAFFLSEQKKKVLVVDLDPQGNSSTRLVDKEYEDKDQYIPNYKFSGTRTLDLFNPELSSLEPLVCPSNISLIWAYDSDAELSDIEMLGINVATVFSDNLKKLKGQYDYILIDCPPALGNKLVSALASSTHVISPVKLSGFAISGLEALITTIMQVRNTINPELKIAAIVANQMDRSPRNQREFDKLKGFVGEMLVDTKIYQRSPIDHSSTDGLPVWKTRHGFTAGIEVKKAIREILENIN